MKTALMKCLAGKEPLVCAHSVTVLSDLAVNEYPCDLEHNVPPVTTTSHHSTTTSPCTSPSFHLSQPLTQIQTRIAKYAAQLSSSSPFTPTALLALLSRTRDPDTLAQARLRLHPPAPCASPTAHTHAARDDRAEGAGRLCGGGARRGGEAAWELGGYK